MKNLLSLFALILISFANLNAKPVDLATAKKAGLNFLRHKTTSPEFDKISDLTLVFKAASSDELTVYYYVFNTPDGFVIVSGDDCVLPILGYSDEKAFRTTNMVPSLRKWLDSYKAQIRYAIHHNLPPTAEIIQAWEELKGNLDINAPVDNRNSVDPLVQTKWDQPAPYNELCPEGSVTGCVATAMAQIMKYWNHPETGQGFHSFDHDNYGTLSANFGSTTYQWSAMPNSVTNSNNAVATLMYHCGVSVDMGYSPEVSGAWVIQNSPTPEANSEYAFRTYFGYDNTLQGIQRKDYSDAQWESTLKAELDASRPILYDGFGNGGGHAFVCDGYDNNDFFHYNWGWSGYYDGYFETSALNPGGTGTGGGTGGYNSGQEVIIGIKPANGGGGGSMATTLQLYDALYMPTNIGYGAAFELSTNILNAGNVDFSGDYAAAVFDQDFNFVDFIEVKTGWTLTAGYVYTGGITFSSPGSFSFLPGTYYAAVFYRKPGEEWTIIGNGDYQNLAQFEISYANAIELYSAMTISPGTVLERGKPASVNFNILNDGLFTFTGTYSVDLYDLNGNFVEHIGEITEGAGLPPGYLYLEPFLTFSTPSVTADPGTYLLAVTHQWAGYDWELTGSSYFANPVFVTVKAATPQPDIYESNNTVGEAYNLSLSFSGNTAVKNTVGSDAHTGTDYDFYKINLAAGYDYLINVRMHDSYNSGNGNTYTLDGQFSYSFDGVNWSEAYDDIIPGDIAVPNGGTVYFFATPYFLGQLGTYLLDMNISRTAITSTNEIDPKENVYVFPNPASDVINIDLSESITSFHSVKLLDIWGQEITNHIINGDRIQLNVQGLMPGMYVLQLASVKGFITRKILISR